MLVIRSKSYLNWCTLALCNLAVKMCYFETVIPHSSSNCQSPVTQTRSSHLHHHRISNSSNSGKQHLSIFFLQNNSVECGQYGRSTCTSKNAEGKKPYQENEISYDTNYVHRKYIGFLYECKRRDDDVLKKSCIICNTNKYIN